MQPVEKYTSQTQLVACFVIRYYVNDGSSLYTHSYKKFFHVFHLVVLKLYHTARLLKDFQYRLRKSSSVYRANER